MNGLGGFDKFVALFLLLGSNASQVVNEVGKIVAGVHNTAGEKCHLGEF